METYLEPADVARETGLSGSAIRALADRGVLPVVAVTRRGVRLFSEADVEALKARRAGLPAPPEGTAA